MFREMRRKNQALPQRECVAALQRGTSGVLAVTGDGGYPYAVPLSYVYHGGKLFFHCAASGYKLDAIAHNDKVSFCVIDQDEVVPEKLTTYYRSVIVFGRARILQDATERWHALAMLAERYSPDHEQGWMREIKRSIDRVCMLELLIEHMSGKEERLLAIERSQRDGE